MRKKSLTKLSLFGLLLFTLPSAAWGHTYGAAGPGWVEGFSHPLGGLDHLLAMLAVGLWAAQRGRRMLWGLPLTFAGLMAIGGLLATGGIPLPYVESGIAVSVLVLGLLTATAARLPAALSLILTGAFALFHGHAHGAELPGTVSVFGYITGFILATSLLHFAGTVAGLSLLKAPVPDKRLQLFFRIGGSATAVFGIILFAGVL